MTYGMGGPGAAIAGGITGASGVELLRRLTTCVWQAGTSTVVNPVKDVPKNQNNIPLNHKVV